MAVVWEWVIIIDRFRVDIVNEGHVELCTQQQQTRAHTPKLGIRIGASRSPLAVPSCRRRDSCAVRGGPAERPRAHKNAHATLLIAKKPQDARTALLATLCVRVARARAGTKRSRHIYGEMSVLVACPTSNQFLQIGYRVERARARASRLRRSAPKPNENTHKKRVLARRPTENLITYTIEDDL